MRMLIRAITTFSVAATVSGCTPLHIESTHDPTVDFSKLRTYAWSLSMDTGGSNKAYGLRAREAVDRELGAKGFVATSGDLADFLMSYTVKTRRTSEVRDIPASYSQETDWGRTGGGDQYNVQHTEETLVLAVLDPASRKQLWSALAQTQLPADPAPDNLTKQVNEIVARMLQGFPPR